MKIKSPPMFLRHVKHATTAWPMLIFPFHHEVNVYGHRRKVFSSPVAFYSYATSWEKAKGTNPKLVAQRVPNRISFFMPPRGTRRTFLTHRSIGPRPTFPFVISFAPPRGTGRNFPTHRFISPRPVFFYVTSWQGAEVPDTLLNRSPTDFFFFTPPRGTEQKSTTHCSNGPHNYVARQTKPNTTTDLDQSLTSHAPLKVQARKNRRKQRT